MKVIKVYQDQNGTSFFKAEGTIGETLTKEGISSAKAEAKRMLEAAEFEPVTCDRSRFSQWYDAAGGFVCWPIHVADGKPGYMQVTDFFYLRKGEEAAKCLKAIKNLYKGLIGGDPYEAKAN